MKTRCIIFLLLSVSMALCACNAQRRAERRIRRIVERCPELLSEQAHAIDTFLPVAPVADSAAMPLRPLLDGETLTVTTPQGTFTASIDDDTLSIEMPNWSQSTSPIPSTSRKSSLRPNPKTRNRPI